MQPLLQQFNFVLAVLQLLLQNRQLLARNVLVFAGFLAQVRNVCMP